MNVIFYLTTTARRTPHGVRGLKSDWIPYNNARIGRTPHGVRGLKYRIPYRPEKRNLSHPSRGAWIEIGFHPVLLD